VGRHCRPTHRLRNTVVVSSALAAAGTALFAVPASADPLDGCTEGARNPDIRVCQDNPDYDHGSALHALVKANPLLCVHAVILDGRRVVGTRDCSHTREVIPVVPVEPAPAGSNPCSCTPAPVVTPAPAEETPGSSSSSSSSSSSTTTTVTSPAPTETTPAEQLPEAPAPQTITNNTATSPLPAVTH
jgi:hypothetical protein